MALDVYKSVISACPLFLRPVIRILLRAGITYKQFATIARSIFVEVAADEYGINGRKTNTSRIAILTGISRSEVTKIRKNLEKDDEQFEFPTVLSNASRILSAWHNDAEFLDDDKKPIRLPVEAPKGHASFTQLVNKYGGDIPLTAMLKELKKTGSVEQLENGSLEVITRFYIPTVYDSNKVFSMAETFSDIGATAFHNFVREDDDLPRIQIRALNNQIPEEYAAEFQDIYRSKCFELLEEIDDWLSEKEISATNNPNKKIRLGLGVYMIQDTPLLNKNED